MFGRELGIQHNSNGTAQIFPRKDENKGERVRVIYLASPPRDFPSKIFTGRTSEDFVF